eukprot:GHVP01055209.1.p1 GENE.GHVP01055209.1~~GHVP01055209.1.p1  ORF type:complete len:546 (+),score=85.00 GHVP01055209.1:75-1712(+)
MNYSIDSIRSTVFFGILLFTFLAALDSLNMFGSNRSVVQDLSMSRPSNNKITVCAMESNTPNIVEWIEYHRLQGVDKFSLYYPASLDKDGIIYLNHLQSLYRSQGLPYLLEVLPAMGSNPNFQKHMLLRKDQNQSQEDFRHQQKANYVHCLNRNRKTSKWVALIDTDEYLMAPENKNLWDYLKDQHFAIGVHAKMVSFGPSGNMWNFQEKLVVDPETYKIQILFDPRDNARFRFYKNGRKLKSNLNSNLTAKFDLKNELDEFQIQEFDDIRELIKTQNEKRSIEEILSKSLERRYDKEFNGHEAPASPFDVPFLPRKVKKKMKSPKDWANYFPLIVEDQVRSMPTYLPAEERANLALKFLPHCPAEVEAYDQKIQALKINGTEITDKNKPKLSPECVGILPRGFTKIGKSIYNTSWSNDKADRSLNWGERGCLRPWCHLCADYKPLLEPGPTKIQLHHHQFLSVQQRTFGARSFQKKAVQAKFQTKNFAELLELQSSVYNDSKKKFSKLIRQKIRNYGIKPMYFDVSIEGQKIVSDGLTARKSKV